MEKIQTVVLHDGDKGGLEPYPISIFCPIVSHSLSILNHTI